MKKLTPEARDNVMELLHHAGFPVLLELLEAEAATVEADVLKLSMDTSTTQELLNRKLRAEGARKLTQAFAKRVTAMKAKT